MTTQAQPRQSRDERQPRPSAPSTTASPRKGASLKGAFLKGALLKGALGVGAATTAASGANYLSNVLLGRSLGPAEFSDAALVVSGLLLLSALALGFQLTIARDLASGSGYDRLIAIRRKAAIVGGVVGGVLALASPVIKSVFNMASVWPMIFLGLAVPLFFVLAVMRGVVQAQQAFGRLALSLAIEAITRLGVVVVVIVRHYGATGVAIALSISFVVALIPCLNSRRDIAAKQPVSTALLATTLLLVGQVVIGNSDLWIVAARLPDDSGSYAAVALIGRLVFIAAWSIITVVFPSLVQGRESRRGLLWKAAAAIAVFGAVLVALAFIFGDRLITAMMGNAFAPVGHLLWPYALATTLFVIANLFAVEGVARGDATAPAIMVAAAAAQVVVLSVGAARGIAWVVYAQVVLMAFTLVCVIGREVIRASTRPVVAAAELSPP